MNNKNFIPSLFIISFLSIIIGTLLKILHQPFSEILLGLGLILTIIYSIFCLVEIYNNKRLFSSEKSMWLFSFLFINTIAGLIYILYARKRINRDFKLNV